MYLIKYIFPQCFRKLRDKCMEQNRYLGENQINECRPTIVFENLNLSQIDKSAIAKDGFCDCIKIPMIQAENNSLLYKQTFCYLIDKVANNFNDIFPQLQKLFLIVDDNDGKRKYYIGADIQLESWDEARIEQSIEKINPTIQEQAAIELVLLKITNPEQFLLKYTRYQVAQRPEIMNRFGLFHDSIDNNAYYSFWATENYKNGVIAYIPNVQDKNSKIEFQSIGI